MVHSVVATLLVAFSVRASATVECPDGDLGKCTNLTKCDKWTVIKDVATGWLDDCEGLVELPGNHTVAECEAACKKDMGCAVWQLSDYEDGVKKTTGPFCYTGVPKKDCEHRPTPKDFKPIAGQRLQRGAVEVTGSALGVQVMGLHQFLMTSGEVADQELRCKEHCYSDAKCGVWQYEVFEGAQSCWIEKDTPPTGVENKTNEFSKRVSAGEYITHYCPTPTPDETPWPWIIAGIIVGVLALGAILYLLLKKKPKVKKTRAVKITEKKEEPPKIVWMPVMQQVVQPVQYQVIQQAPVVQQAPVTTAVEYVTQPTTAVEYVTQPTTGSVVLPAATTAVSQPLLSGPAVLM